MKYIITVIMNSGREYRSMPTELDAATLRQMKELPGFKGRISFYLEDEETFVVLPTEIIESLGFTVVKESKKIS